MEQMQSNSTERRGGGVQWECSKHIRILDFWYGACSWRHGCLVAQHMIVSSVVTVNLAVSFQVSLKSFW